MNGIRPIEKPEMQDAFAAVCLTEFCEALLNERLQLRHKTTDGTKREALEIYQVYCRDPDIISEC